MVEPLLSGIVLELITVTALGLFVAAAFLQYRVVINLKFNLN
jgi:hypothetical protein